MRKILRNNPALNNMHVGKVIIVYNYIAFFIIYVQNRHLLMDKYIILLSIYLEVLYIYSVYIYAIKCIIYFNTIVTSIRILIFLMHFQIIMTNS